MNELSTEQVARQLGINPSTLSRYIKAKKIYPPKATMAGGIRIRLWTEADIERVRQLLPKIKNGRKTRYEKKQSALSNQRSANSKTKAKTKKKH